MRLLQIIIPYNGQRSLAESFFGGGLFGFILLKNSQFFVSDKINDIIFLSKFSVTGKDKKDKKWNAEKRQIFLGAIVHMNPVPGKGYAVNAFSIIKHRESFLHVILIAGMKGLITGQLHSS